MLILFLSLRFYFLSNDELLEILSKTKEPERIQPHLRKCFDGISRLLFNSDHEIEAMISNENEIVKFRERIVPAKSKGMVELWMSEVDDAMKDALVHLTFMAIQEWKDHPNLQYFESFPGQCILCACFINFTKAGTTTIETGSKWNVSTIYTKSLCTLSLTCYSQL